MLVDWRHSPDPAFSLDDGRYRENLLLFPRPADNLNANRQAFFGMTDRHHCRRISQEIEPLRVAPGIEVVDSFSVDCPGALAMTERRNGCWWAKQDRVLLHLGEEPRSERITPNPGIEQRIGG